jgi:hypothetical protein
LDENKTGSFMLGDLVYQKKFGDYYLWSQILKHVSDQDGISNVMFLTMERKGDWWLKHEDVAWGPLPSLSDEMRTKGKVERFWMYTLEDFMVEAKPRLKANVSDTSISDIASSGDEDSGDLVPLWLSDLPPAPRPTTSEIEKALLDLGYVPYISTGVISIGPLRDSGRGMAMVVSCGVDQPPDDHLQNLVNMAVNFSFMERSTPLNVYFLYAHSSQVKATHHSAMAKVVVELAKGTGRKIYAHSGFYSDRTKGFMVFTRILDGSP